GLLEKQFQAADFLLALFASDGSANQRGRRIAGEYRRLWGKIDVQSQGIDQGHLARHPAREVNERALAGDNRSDRSSHYRSHAVGSGNGDQFRIRVDGDAGAQVRLEVAAFGKVMSFPG